MDAIAASLIDFQILLVSSLINVVAFGVLLIGFGLVVTGASPVFGYRMKRLGLQVIGACLLVLIAHSLMVEAYGAEIPIGLLIAVYALVSILLLQGFLNLVFGPAVGNRVIASLIETLLISLLYLVLRPFSLIRNLFR